MNNDGVRQDKESKLVGWTAVLSDATGTNLLATVQTGKDGRPVFYPFAPGTSSSGRPAYL